MNADNHVRETISALDGLIQGLRQQIESDPPKPSISDYVRLVQLRIELSPDPSQDDPRPLYVHWVDHETTADPDPDPNVPWEGDQPLA